jgi:hypothetical protein
MRRQFCDAYSLRTFLYNVPDRLFCHTVAPDVARLVHLAEDPAPLNISSFQPLVQFRDDPIGNRNRSDVSAFAQQIDNGTVVLPLLEMVESQADSLMPS